MMPKIGFPGRDHAQNQRDWRAIRAHLKKVAPRGHICHGGRGAEKCFGEPLRQQMGFDESLPARKSR
jgi:hypothetical protein